ncbi:hypothetical protein ACERIM_15910 [Natrinema sp. H-ect1]|uniref:hypothetical protein n=1 Tax=Natrinema sp. H-ect1 TaxID=3242700 RepID=UPI00359CBBE4
MSLLSLILERQLRSINNLLQKSVSSSNYVSLQEPTVLFNTPDGDRGEYHTVSAPRVADATISMECTLHDSLAVHDKLMCLGD